MTVRVLGARCRNIPRDAHLTILFEETVDSGRKRPRTHAGAFSQIVLRASFQIYLSIYIFSWRWRSPGAGALLAPVPPPAPVRLGETGP